MRFFWGGCCLGWIVVLGGFGHAQAASCEWKAKQGCVRGYAKAKRVCEKKFRVARKPCRLTRMNAFQSCKQVRASTPCVHRAVRDKALEVCRKKRVEELGKCSKPPAGNTPCSNQLKACEDRCRKECRVCTLKGIEPCLSQCSRIHPRCSSTAVDGFVTCRYRAEQGYEVCKRNLVLASWVTYYTCMSGRFQNYFRCKHKAKDEESACYKKVADGYRFCIRKEVHLRELCKVQVPKACQSTTPPTSAPSPRRKSTLGPSLRRKPALR